MNKVVKHKRFLARCATNPNVAKKSTLDQLSCLVEIFHNLSSIPLSASEKKYLCKHLDRIGAIAKCSRERKARQLITQHGGSLLPIIIPAVFELFRLLSKNEQV